MKKVLNSINLTSNKNKAKLKTSFHLQTPRANLRPDRRVSLRLHRLHLAHFQVGKRKNGRLASRSLRIARANGHLVTTNAHLLFHRPAYHPLFRKYRLKSELTPQTLSQFSATPFKLQAGYRLTTGRRLITKRAGRSLRQRALTSARLHSYLYSLRRCVLHAPKKPAEPPYRRRWAKLWTKRYQKRNRRRYYARAGWVAKVKPAPVSSSLRRLLAETFRALRVNFYGYTVFRQRRWWLNRRLRRLERKAKKSIKAKRRHVPVKPATKQSRWIRRRRFCGKRLFAGMMGPRRWRAERHDKFFLRRERRQEPARRGMVYRSNDAIKVNTLKNVQRLRNLRTRLSSQVFGSFQTAVTSYAQGAQLAHRRVSFKRAVTLRSRKKMKKSKKTNNFIRTLSRRLQVVTPGKQKLVPLALLQGCTTRITEATKVYPVSRKRYLSRTRRGSRRFRRKLRVYLQKNYKSSRLHKATLQRQLVGSALTVAAGTATPTRLRVRKALGRAKKQKKNPWCLQRFIRNKFFGMNAAKGSRLESPVANSPVKPELHSIVRRVATTEYVNKSTTFLQRNETEASSRPKVSSYTSFLATAKLTRQRLRYSELRFYHKRPRVRLPCTAVTRRRRRKGGLVTFVRNSLKRPHTLLGQQHLLLPPTSASAVTKTIYGYGMGLSLHSMFSPTTRQEDTWPLFWRRPHNRANIRAINAIRRRQYSRRKRQYILRQKRWAAHLQAPLPPNYTQPSNPLSSEGKMPALFEQEKVIRIGVNNQQLAQVNCAPAVGKPTHKIARFLNRKRRKKSLLTYSKGRTLLDLRRTSRHLTPTASRTIERTFLAARQSELKSGGLWQARSVRSMLAKERAISAWSPQLSTRNRRAHYPRVRGVPVRRRVLSFTAKRARRNFNAKLLARNIPQRRYTDYTAIKLQYYYGSVGSSGYVRFRRVHRPHSKHNRWWRPNKVAVPFAHPFSRRALNAKRYLRFELSAAHSPRSKSFTRLVRNTRAVFLHSKFPSRPIPWRNFRYKRPRWGRTPKTLQRWTFVKRDGKTGRVRPAQTKLVLKRTPRELRELERYTFNRGIWKARRWNLVDKAALRGGIEASLFVALRTIPKTVWGALQQRAGSSAAYTALQHYILDEFRRWGRKEQKMNYQDAATMTANAQSFLVNLLSTALQLSSGAIGQVTGDTQRHSIIRSNSFNKKVQLKAFNFLQSRILPQLDRAPNAESILQRERSGLYRRWLHSVEGAVKRVQLGYVPTKRSRYTANVAIAFGRRRERFPASGRRHKSYDSLLHAFSKKIAPARLRRAAVLQFKRALPRIAFDFRENLLTAGSYAGLSRRSVFARRLSSAGYLSAPWREVLQYRAVTNRSEAESGSTGYGAKRRFLALPLALKANKQAKNMLRAVSPYKQQMRVIRAGILRKALRRRREERPFIDLRHTILQRRLPKERATNPWKLRRAIKRWRAAKMGPYSGFTVQRRAATPGRWTLVHLSAVGPQHEYMALSPLPTVLPSGEQIVPVRTILRKDKRAFRGFVLPVNAPKRRKLRRLVRGVTNRSRVSRRPNPAGRLAVLRNKSHWSEKKDQDFRTATLRHKRISYAKQTLRALKGRIGPRHAAALFGARANKKVRHLRLVRFMNFKHSSGVAENQKQLQNLPNTHMLVQNTSFRSRKRRTCISRSRLARRRNCAYRAPRRRSRKMQSARARFNSRRMREKLAVSEQLLVGVGAEEPTISLWFQKPAIRVVKSEKAKENDALADIAQKEGRYKITAQYVESLTAFLPELMNYLLSKKIEKKFQQIRYSTAQHLVRNIYWSLRVYLNVDPFDIRFFARDKTPAARVRLFEQISDMSEFQVTEQPQRAALRYRFQPSKLLRAPNTMRFRGDWLRAFFPAWHALYQENPEDYRKFLFKTRRIRSLRIGPRDMGSWITEKQRIGHETRARQILTLRYSRKRRRFETVLQTTRRIPVPENISTLAAGSSRKHFFNRKFSTYAGRGLAATSRWLHRQKRFVALEEGWRVVAPVMQIAARSRSVRHLEARSRTNYIATEWAAMSNTFLDARFTRAKSARSRQYIIRMLRTLRLLIKREKFANLVFYTKQLERKLNTITPSRTRWTRSARRTAAASLRSSWVNRNRTDLQELRATYPTLRVGTLRSIRRLRSASKLRRSRLHTSAITHKAPAVLPKEAIFSFPTLAQRLERGKKWRALALSSLPRRLHRGKKRKLWALPFIYSGLRRDKKGKLLALSSFPRRLRPDKKWKLPTLRALPRHLDQDKKRKLLPIRAFFNDLRRDKNKELSPARAFCRRLRSNKKWKLVPRSAIPRRLHRDKKGKLLVFLSPSSRLRPNKKGKLLVLSSFSRSSLRRSKKRKLLARSRAKGFCSGKKAKLSSFRSLSKGVRHGKKRKLVSRKKRSMVRLPKLVNKCFLPQNLLQSSRFGLRSLRLARATWQSRQERVRFFKRTLSRGMFRSLAFARTCALHTKFNRQAPFEAHRPKLWDALTQRWMKKHRIGRYWLRDTSRWLRDPWLSQIVACDAALRPDRFGGELRSRAQQVGEYVADVDAEGRDIKRKNAPRERHKFQKVLPVVVDPEIKKTNKILKKGSRLDRSLARQRLRISRQAARKPMPGIRLANYEFRDVIREHKENKSKSVKQKKEEEEACIKAFWARKAKKLPPLRPKRLPLKHPANLWLPHVIWKEIQRRIRKFEWRESDEVFFRRGFRRAFQFHSNERRKAPWLEKLMYTRATYSTRLSEFRRRQYPHEQKKFKWLQRVRRMLYPGRNAWYIKGRRWPQLRRYNDKLHYSLYNFHDRGAARRHFKKLNGRTRPPISAFVSMGRGLTDRLDIICLQLGFAPSIYWARIVAQFGLLRVNGKTVYEPTYRLKSDDIIYPRWDVIARFQHYFRPFLRTREEYLRRNRASTTLHPTNMEYHRGIRAFIYRHAPEEFDLRKSGRIFAPYLRWFKLDAV